MTSLPTEERRLSPLSDEALRAIVAVYRRWGAAGSIPPAQMLADVISESLPYLSVPAIERIGSALPSPTAETVNGEMREALKNCMARLGDLYHASAIASDRNACWEAMTAAGTALARASSATAGADAVQQWFRLHDAYHRASEAYNARLALVRTERERGNWSFDVHAEYRALRDAQRAAIAGAETLYQKLAAAPPILAEKGTK